MPIAEASSNVVPKDSRQSSDMDTDLLTMIAPPSASKRKREAQHDLFETADHETGDDSPSEHSPKRSRGRSPQRDGGASQNSTPPHQRGLLRRKQKVGNLSNLNLRHKAKQQQQSQKEVPGSRDSKFQEGSLTDKPSAKPPSVFTRVPEDGDLAQLDNLMTNYHDEAETADQAIEQEQALMEERVHAIAGQNTKKDDQGGILRFGRQFVSNFAFHPVSLWNRVWNDTKDDILAKNLEEAERMARQKAEAEARYAEMKRLGQFKLQPVGLVEAELPSPYELCIPGDSAVVLDMDGGDDEQHRQISSGTVLIHPTQSEQANSEHAHDEVLDSATKSFRSLASRLHFKRPSLTNIKSDLKRVRSDLNIPTIGLRELSNSVSPTKSDMDSSLRQSVSKIDLKKQQKLSKRVSDLELRLQQARQELDDALVDASPAPKLNSKYQRFVGSGTLRRSKFTPGLLPSLPSQQVFDPALLNLNAAEQASDDHVNIRSEARPRKAFDLTSAFDEESENDETIRASRERQPYPTRASSLFTHITTRETSEMNDHVETVNDTVNSKPINEVATAQSIVSSENNDQRQAEVEDTIMDDEKSLSIGGDGDTTEPVQSASYNALDAKLKALDAQVRRTSKSKSKKRKSGEKDGPYKLGENDYLVDEDWEAENGSAKKKQRRKPSNKNDRSPTTKRIKNGHGSQSSPTGKKSSKGVTAKTSHDTPSNTSQQTQPALAEADASLGAELDMDDADPGVDDLTPGRTSLDSQGQPLEPLYEVEEEMVTNLRTSTTTIPLNDSPVRSTAHATPARFSREFARTRSSSPNKRISIERPAVPPKQMAPTKMKIKSTDAVEKSPSKNEDVVPAPDGVNGSGAQEAFAWPEDVF